MAASIAFRRFFEVTRNCNRIFFYCPQSSRATARTICDNYSVRLNSLHKGSNGYLLRVLFKETKCLPCFERTSITLGIVQSPINHSNISYVTRRMCSTSSRCWNCNSVLSKDKFQKLPFFCRTCNGIQPIDENISHFQRLECNATFEIDVSQLQKVFRQLQSQLHPDKFSQKSQKEQSFSADQSSAVNKAYRTLLRPLSRGLYMLEQASYPVEEGDTDVDPSFLLEIMEVNEKLAELNDLDAVRKIGDANSEILQKLMKELSAQFESKNFEKAREVLMRLKYYANIDDKVKEKLGTSTV